MADEPSITRCSFQDFEMLLRNNVIAKDVTNHYTSDEDCMSACKGPLEPSTALGGFSDKESNETKKVVAWEKAFIQLVKDELVPMVPSKNLTLFYSSESSIEEELKKHYPIHLKAPLKNN
ncbi:hypothetical protein L1987_37189 [Smallanthus sonchifolius]|uniref:Uncharacterized protein n=1 Tax=Smallanthus sonchifolius TaxID=185202 RepID=A0ACB9HFM8_9ASTR|nr:hypothetical protein L1987_37189 [Smallanthus sonchifolius]